MSTETTSHKTMLYAPDGIRDVGHMGMTDKQSNSALCMGRCLPEAETADKLLAMHPDSESFRIL